jgi:hypothetical protein
LREFRFRNGRGAGHLGRGPIGEEEREERLAIRSISRGPVRIPDYGEAGGVWHEAMIKNSEEKLHRILFSI